MAVELKVPSPGESITEVQIAQWLKADGDYVERDEEVAEIDSDKATLSLVAEASGILKILVQAGETVAVGAVVASIDTSAAAPEKKLVEEKVASEKSAPEKSASEKVVAEKVAPQKAAQEPVAKKSENDSYAAGQHSSKKGDGRKFHRCKASHGHWKGWSHYEGRCTRNHQ